MELDLQLLDHRLDALDPCRRMFGCALLKKVVDVPRKRDDAVLGSDADMSGSDTRLPCLVPLTIVNHLRLNHFGMVSASDLRNWKAELPQALQLALAYFAAALAAVTYARVDGGVALLWFATPLLAVDLRYRPERSWALRLAACAAASALATSLEGLGVGVALPFALINIAEGAAIAWLMRRFVPVPGHLTSLRELAILIIVAGVVVPAGTAVPAGLLAHWATGLPAGSNAFNWYAAHALGTLTVMPMVKLVIGGDVAGWARSVERREACEAALLTGFLVAVTGLVFAQTRLPLMFVPLLPLMLMVFRLGRLGAATALLVITVVGAICTARGLGPVAIPGASTSTKLLLFQLYLVVATLMALPAATELKRRKLLFSEVQAQAALHKIITDRSGDIIMAVTADGIISFASPSLVTIAGYGPDAVVGKLARHIVAPDDVDAVEEAHRQAMQAPDQTIMFEFRATKASGELAWFESHTCAITDENDQISGSVNVVRDISERKALESSLQRAAGTDALTGLPNRRAFEVAERQLQQRLLPWRHYLAVFDLDHFKDVNDQFGHGVGDEVLCAFADILRANTRSSDTVARLGGEEFAVLFANLNLQAARDACERVRMQFAAARMITADGRTVHATVSVGLAALDGDTGLADALTAADVALYQSKDQGRNRLSLAA